MLKLATNTRFASLATCALAGALALASPRSAQAGNSSTESSQVRYRQATDAYKQHKFEDARRILLSLWTEAHTYDVAVTLVQAEYQLGHFAAAANYLTFALANVPPTEKLDSAAKMKKDLSQLRELAAQLQVTLSEPGAEITIDGTSVGTSPLGEFYVDDGQHTVAARLGERTASKVFKAEKGKVWSIELNLPKPEPEVAPVRAAPTAAAPSPAAAQQATPTRPQNDTSRSIIPVVIGSAATVAAIGVGIGFRVAAGSSYDDLTRLRDKNGAKGCTEGTASPGDCAAQHDASATTDSRRNIATAAFVIAGAAAVGTAVYWLWPQSHSTQGASARQMRIGSAVAPGTAGVWLSGKF